MKNYYEILNLEEGAPKEEIRRAFYRLAKKFHPDISNDHKQFLQILRAYKTLIEDQNTKSDDRRIGKKRNIRTVIPKRRVTYAVSLQDIAKIRTYYPGKGKRRRAEGSLKGYDVCVHLTPDEIKSAVSVELDVPAHVICPLCRGDRTPCSLCSGRGYIMKAVPVMVDIPVNLKHGDIFGVPLRGRKHKEYTFFVIKELWVKIELNN
ncbi:MAG: DnaJ domain-containing protein [Spirochaetota bacterium]|nr:MAG: DnaJ domain-containing protein [Spirochaetota bacterium]